MMQSSRTTVIFRGSGHKNARDFKSVFSSSSNLLLSGNVVTTSSSWDKGDKDDDDAVVVEKGASPWGNCRRAPSLFLTVTNNKVPTTTAQYTVGMDHQERFFLATMR